MHLGPNHFLLSFQNLLSLLPTRSFLEVFFISQGQVFLDFYHQKLLFYDFVQIDSVFYDFYMEIDKILLL